MRAVAATLLLLGTLAGQIDERQALARAFPATRLERQIAVLTPAQRQALAAGHTRPPRIFKHWIARDGERLVGYAVIEDVPGKCEPITYLLAVGPCLTVRSVEILAYRESHGGEVQRADWRAQLVGKGPQSPLRVGEDVASLAGATISCRAVTEGVRRNLACLAALYELRNDPGTFLNSCDGAETTRTRLLMGTTLSVTVLGRSPADTGRAQEAAFAAVAGVEAVLSHYRPESALSALAAEAGQRPRPRDPLLVDFLEQAQRWHACTGGAFDVTVGPLVKLWQQAEKAQQVPAADQVAAARALCGPGILTLHGDSAALTREGAALDPGALGKGFALDRAAAALRAQGVVHALLNFGGQVLALGPRPDGSPWPVRLRGAAGDAEVALASGSLSTTADDEQGMVIAGQRFSHVIDPRTGRPAAGMRAAVVYAQTAAEADALSTALYVLGCDAGVAFARRHGVKALIAGAGRSWQAEGFAELGSAPAR